MKKSKRVSVETPNRFNIFLCVLLFVSLITAFFAFRNIPLKKINALGKEVSFASAGSASWYNTQWKFRRAIIVSNSLNTATLNNYQVLIPFSSSNFSFSKALSQGQDLRFTDSDGTTLLYYWIESYNASSQTATIYVKVSSIPAASSKVIYVYYGNANAYSASTGDQTFAFYDGFENALSNASTYQTTPTYDGSGQSTEPSITSFAPNTWHGYTYWMSTTPDPNGNDSYENPSILASNDGITWVVPPGATNPLVAAPPCDHNSDTTLLYNPATNELWMYFNDTRRAERCNGYQGQPWYNHNYVKFIKSADGINWSAPITVLDWDLGSNPLYMSPSVVLHNNIYSLWTSSDANKVVLYQSRDGINWGVLQPVNIADLAWHLNVIYVPNKSEYWMISDYPSALGSLRFAKSIDGINWTTYPNPALSPTTSWDMNPYRSTFLYDSLTNTIRVWYSAYNNTSVWHMGYTQSNYDVFLSELSKGAWTTQGSGTWSISNNQVKRGQYSGQLVQTAGMSMLVSKSTPLQNNFYQEWDMYDDMNSGFKVVRSSNASGNEVGLGVWTGSSSTKYVYHDKSYVYHVTAIPRMLGWHKFGMLVKSDSSITFFIDGKSVGMLTGQFANAAQIHIEGYYGGLTTYYVDDIRVRKWTNPEPTVFVGSEQSS